MDREMFMRLLPKDRGYWFANSPQLTTYLGILRKIRTGVIVPGMNANWRHQAVQTLEPVDANILARSAAAPPAGCGETVTTGGGHELRSEVRDPVAFPRYEYKYLISPDLMEPIRSFIKPYCDIDPYADRESDKFYTIRTLYLDTADYRTYRDKEGEAPARFKLRVRTYGNDLVGPVKFEVKHRLNDVYLKTSLVVPGEQWPRYFWAPIRGFPSTFNEAEKSALDNFIRLFRTLGAGPKMLIRYERQAFRSRIDRYVRVSFDRRICHQTVSAYELEGQTAKWRFNDDSHSLGEPGARVILELKFMTRAPLWLSDMVRRFELVRRGFSKYCTAVSRTLDPGQGTRELARAMPTILRMRSRGI
jgi:hypothetical protein